MSDETTGPVSGAEPFHRELIGDGYCHLYEFAGGVPLADTLDHVSTMLSCVHHLLTSQDEVSSHTAYGAAFILEAAMAAVDGAHSGVMRAARRGLVIVTE